MKTSETIVLPAPMDLLQIAGSLAVHQALYAAASLRIADLLEDSSLSTLELSLKTQTNEFALYRLLRLTASRGVFAEIRTRVFANTPLSQYLREGVCGSVRSILMLQGSDFFLSSLSQILYSVKTGEPAWAKSGDSDGFAPMRQDPTLAKVFDDAMTSMTLMHASAVASAYDFGRWQTLTDVGGGNGAQLYEILLAHPHLQGILADQPQVIERAKKRQFIAGELAKRSSTQECDFLRHIPSGSRAYLLKNVLVNWSDDHAQRILCNCRRAVPDNGALILVDFTVAAGNLPSRAKAVDVLMLALYGGKVRSIEEHRELLAGAGFRLHRVLPLPGDLSLIEAFPA